jgi:hypothetical protein
VLVLQGDLLGKVQRRSRTEVGLARALDFVYVVKE